MIDEKAASKTKVSVITGFLGAGKTTLLNTLLTNNEGKKYAIIVNEFGEIGIDNDLVIGADEEIFELNNGCVCCNVRGDLIRILNSLFKRKSSFDAILIETTGLANPAPVAQTFFADDDIARKSSLDGIITVVDAVNIMQNLNDYEEATNQIAFSDVVIINKLNAKDAAPLEQVEQAIKAINQGVRIISKDVHEIKYSNIGDLNSYENLSEDALLSYFPPKSNEHHNHEGHHNHHHHHHNHLEQNGVRALAIKTKTPLIESRFVDFLSQMIDNFGPELLRFKGIVRIQGSKAPFVFNGVHMMLDADYRIDKTVDDDYESRLVFIGRGLKEDEIRARFSACEGG